MQEKEQLVKAQRKSFHENPFVFQLWDVRSIFDFKALSNIHNYMLIILLHPGKATRTKTKQERETGWDNRWEVKASLG